MADYIPSSLATGGKHFGIQKSQKIQPQEDTKSPRRFALVFGILAILKNCKAILDFHELKTWKNEKGEKSPRTGASFKSTNCFQAHSLLHTIFFFFLPLFVHAVNISHFKGAPVCRPGSSFAVYLFFLKNKNTWTIKTFVSTFLLHQYA